MALEVPHTLHARGGSLALGGNFAGGAFTGGHVVAAGTGGVGLCGMGGLASSSGPGRCASDLTLVSAPCEVGPWSSATDRTLGSSPAGTEETAEGSASDSTVDSTTTSLIMRGDGHTLGVAGA